MRKKPISDAMSDCVWPDDVMLCILARLPVKSLLRFKSVCKRWRELFATPRFIKWHHDRFSDDPKNEAFIMHSRSDGDKRTTSLFSISSNIKKATNLDFPYPVSFLSMCSLGCCNGLVCIRFLFFPNDMRILLWNPVLRLSKFVRIPEPGGKMSIGFGYDVKGDDFKVVLIICPKGKNVERVELYSAKSDSWERIELTFQLGQKLLSNESNGNVNGNPYWITDIDQNANENEGVEDQLDDGWLWFDVTKLKFKILPLPPLKLEEDSDVLMMVDWKGSFATVVCNKKQGMVETIDVWVFDNGEMIWRKNHTFGPIEMRIKTCVYCTINGMIMGERPNGKLCVFDPKIEWVKEIENVDWKHVCDMYGYSESLAYVEGMEQVVVKKEEEEEEEDDEEHDPIASP